MKLKKNLPFAQSLLQTAIAPGDIAIDGTAGNGHDTVYLAGLTGKDGHVYGFDIQKEAIEHTAKKLADANLDQQCTLFQTGHQHITANIPKKHFGKITGAIFNLGYLPGGDKTIVTMASTTIPAIEQLLDIMAPEGIIVLVIYHGHPGGSREKDEILAFAAGLDQQKAHVLQYSFINQVNSPPFVIAIEKR
ncbi:Putative rRNA methylase [Bacillus sp. OV322]|uniref:class I SAM-dependent methyltransferase n=1 Tax=Bacillus sp. OV322 TaxID=1882764 RepID=UPI0008E1765B|nr:class I SAM-dependent methyltransferase [Bacillus sp. OV322]SFC59003.1 Putative rRNA methylase [Bacillus sp. OV322]